MEHLWIWVVDHFKNPGKSIKAMAVALFVLELILATLGAAAMIIYGFIEIEYAGYLVVLAPVELVVTYCASFFANLLLYGFGVVVDYAHVQLQKEQVNEFPRFVKATPAAAHPNALHMWNCETCGKPISRTPCPYCSPKPEAPVRPQAPKSGVSAEGNAWTCPGCGKPNLHTRSSCWSCGLELSRPEPEDLEV